MTILKRLDAEIFRGERLERSERTERLLPLYQRKLHVHVDWQGDTVRP
jgi:hypothetical protein